MKTRENNQANSLEQILQLLPEKENYHKQMNKDEFIIEFKREVTQKAEILGPNLHSTALVLLVGYIYDLQQRVNNLENMLDKNKGLDE